MGEHTPNLNLYTTGGSVNPQEQIYATRKADEELLYLCERGEFAYLLTSRQIGKSSLVIRAVQKLRDIGIQAAHIDLQGITEDGLSAEGFYLGLIHAIEDELNISTDYEDWWQGNAHLGFVQRLTTYFRSVLLQKHEGKIVIFLDEVENTLRFPYKNDFFAAIRFLYNERAAHPSLNRLSFVIIGSAQPGDLIDDPKLTPFNIGRRLELTDFTLEEASALTEGMGVPPNDAQNLLRWIFKWTNGHPYLTQRLIVAVIQSGHPARTEADVDAIVRETLLGTGNTQDDNLAHTGRMLTVEGFAPNFPSELRLYDKIRRRGRISDEHPSQDKNHLKLTGIVRKRDGALRVSNRIYESVFNDQWVRKHNPADWRRRAWFAAGWLTAGIFIAALAAVPVLLAQNRDLKALADTEMQLRKQLEVALGQAESGKRKAEESARDAVEARNEATASAEGEKEARTLAENSLENTEKARREAESAKDFAVRQQAEALKARDEAEHLRRVAIGEQLGAMAELTRTQAEDRIQRSAQIAREAVKQAPEAPPVIGYQALLQSLILLPRQVAQASHSEGLSYGSFSPDGERFVTLTIKGGLPKPSSDDLDYYNTKIVLHTMEVLEVTKNHVTASEKRSWIQPDASGWDIEYLVTPSTDGADTFLTVTSALTGNQIGQERAEGGVRHVSISSDGRILAAASGGGNIVQVWDLTTSREIRLKPAVPVSHLYLSPSGKYLALVSNNIRRYDRGRILRTPIRIWNVTSKSMVASVPSDSGINKVVFSPNDQFFFVKGGQNPRLFETVGGKQSKLNLPKSSYLAFSPDGEYLATTALLEGVRVMPVRSGAQPFALPDRTSGDLIFSPDGKYLATWTEGSIKIWNSKSLIEIMNSADKKLPRANSKELQIDHIKLVKFSPDNRYLATWGWDNMVRVWEWQAEEEVARILHEEFVQDVDFSSDEQFIATTGLDGYSRVWELPSEERFIRRTVQRYLHVGLYNGFSSNGRFLATMDYEKWHLGNCNKDLPGDPGIPCSRLRVRDTANQYKLVFEEEYRNPPPEAIAFSTDEKYLAVMKVGQNKCNTVQVWELLKDGHQWRALGPEIKVGEATSLAISSGGKYVATNNKLTGSNSITVSVWKVGAKSNLFDEKNHCLDSEARVHLLQRKGPGIAHSFTFSPKGNYLAASLFSNTAILLDIASGKETLITHKDLIGAVAFSPNGEYLATASHEIQVLELATGHVTRLKPGNRVFRIAFSLDGRYLAGADGEAARVWNMRGGGEVARLSHGESVSEVAFDMRSNYLATLTDSGMRVLDITKNREVARIMCPLSEDVDFTLNKISFSPDGKYLRGEDGGAVRVWLWQLDDLLKETHDRLTLKEPTPEEWEEYVGKSSP